MIIIPDKLRRPAEVEREELAKQPAEARAEIDIVEHDANVLIGDLKAEIERKDALIEKMREALNVLVASATPSGPLWHGSAEMQIARAALSVAERANK